MKIIDINITDKHAVAVGDPVIVCGNSDYVARFDFDAEWAEYEYKTARFVYVQDGLVRSEDVIFEGTEAAVPALANVREVLIGVFAGDLRTTTPARVLCELSIRCGTGAPPDPTPEVYDQIMEKLNNIEEPTIQETDPTVPEWAKQQDPPAVDQTYNPTSENAQSGLAVAEAIEASKESDPNRHAMFFNISDSGVLSLKPEYRGAASSEDYPDSISDRGVGAVGSLNAELPADLIIPEEINGVAVDSLAVGMFQENLAAVGLTLPATVFEIPALFCNQAYNVCSVKNTAHIKKIGDKAFRRCHLGRAVFPNLEEISGTLNFYGNAGLFFADVGKVTTISSKAFKYCMQLSKIAASGGNVTALGDEALYSTVSLVNADFLGGLTSIGNGGVWQSKIEYDWDSLQNCSFAAYATHRQANPSDFWSGVSAPVCENPVLSQLCQRDERWADREIANGLKYGDMGCSTLCCLHMYSGLTGQVFNSVIEFEDVVKAINPALWNAQTGTSKTILSLLNGIGLTAVNYSSWNQSTLAAMYEALSHGGYALVKLGKPSGHGVVVYGVNAKGELLCLDSEGRYWYDLSKASTYAMPFHKLVCNNTDLIVVTKED